MEKSPMFAKSRNKWQLRVGALYRGEGAAVDWVSALPAGGTKAQRAYLIQSMKQLMEAMFGETSPLDLSHTHMTVLGEFSRLKLLARWMVARRIWRFSQLAPEDLIEFLRSRRARDGDRLAQGTVNSWLWLFERMWLLRARYIASLRFDPKDIEDDLPLSLGIRDNIPWKALDERTALSLIKDAVAWLDRHGQYIVELSTSVWEARRRQVAKTKHQRVAEAKKFYACVALDPRFQEMAKDCAPPGATPFKVLRQAASLTEGAGITILLFLIGFRSAELLALNSDCLDTSDGLPYVNGIAAKKGDIERRWVAADPLPKTIRLLVDLHGPARLDRNQEALLLQRPPTSPFCLPGRKLERMTPAMMLRRLTLFASAPFRSPSSIPSKLHPHSARKTFAQFVVLRDKRALESLSLHYGHAYRAITDGSYVGSDFELAKLVDEEDRRELSRVLEQLLLAPSLAGKGGSALAAKRAAHVEHRFKGKRGLQTLVESLIEKGIRLAPCDWGYCVYSKPLSACQGNEDGPNEVNRSPDVCATCSNFAVTERHRLWWDERVKRETEFLTRDGLPEQTRKVVELRLSRSEAVLKALVVGNSKSVKAGAN